MKKWMLLSILAALAAVAITSYGMPFITVSSTSRINIFNNKVVNCENPETLVLVVGTPRQAVIYIDTDPTAPYWPLYYGAITQVVINDKVVKTYSPPLVDTDNFEVSEHIGFGFNKIKFSMNHAPAICAIQQQATVNAYLEVIYQDDGGDNGDGDLDTNIILLGLGVALVGVSVYMMVGRK